MANSKGALNAAFHRYKPRIDVELVAALAPPRRARVIHSDGTGVRVYGRAVEVGGGC